MKNVPVKLGFLLVLMRCVWRRIFHSPARNTAVQPKTILIVQLAWLGDMVCTTPMFRAIKAAFPECRVVVVGMPRNQKLLDGHPNVDRYVVWKDDYEYIRNELSNESVDFACITSPHFLSLAFLYLFGVKTIAVPRIENGYSPLETRSFKLLRRMAAIVVPHRMGSYAPREYLRLLEPAGIFSEDTKKTLFFSDAAAVRAQKIFENNAVRKGDLCVCISPSSGNKIKNWPAERFAQVADAVIEKYGAKVFVIGSPLDTVEVEAMLGACRNRSKIINTLGQLSFEELMALMEKMSIFISVDTGPMYIAEAFGVATIDIVGPMDEREQPPRGERHKIVVSPHREKPLIHIMNSRVYDEVAAKKATDDITVEMVLGAFEVLVRQLKK